MQLLSSSVEVISHQPSPFASLKNLKVYPSKSIKIYPVKDLGEYLLKILEIDPTDQHDQEQAAMEINLSTEVKNYLLDGSPDATFTVVSREVFSILPLTRLTNILSPM